ncbi:MAG: glycosyltransferase family 9 protein [Proteobacteria bacterium]|nr:glycosyltransferase family 9 protein [Pseudomonadota bacterium]
MKRILIVKLSALGDFVLATGAFQAIRAHHQGDHVTLLTTAPFAGLARASGYFDEVWIDSRPRPWQVGAWIGLARRLRGGGFARVYDLQHSDRTQLYFRMFGRRRPEWSGVAPGCSHPHANPWRDSMHTLEREAEQLAIAGIGETPAPDLSWLDADIGHLRPDGGFALLVPGGSAHRTGKRWPAAGYAAVAEWLVGRALRPVLIGAAAERAVLADIAGRCSAALDLCGQTSFAEVVALARAAAGAVGNDTGPMHLIAVAGCPCVTLFSAASDPALTAPRGPAADVLERPSLADLGADEVIAALRLR